MQDVCRLCLQAQERDVTPLFREGVNDDECRQLRRQIAELCSIIISQDDDLPKLVCCKCKVMLQNAHEFVNLCKSSNDKLHKHYERSKHCQTKEIISPKEETQQSKERRNRKYSRKNLKCRERSLQICSDISVSSETYSSTLSQNTFNGNIEATKRRSDDNNETDVGSTSGEKSLREQTMLDPIVCCNELAGNNEKQYICEVCSKTFASKSGLRFHLISHYGSKPHVCQHCSKSFAFLSYKKRHERTHTGDKMFICHVCSASFASSNGLRYHLRTHTGEANYHCNTCSKSFARYKYLKEHIFTHTGEKPFVCKLCGSAYGNSGSLFAHEKKCKSRHDFQGDGWAKGLESDHRDDNGLTVR